MDENIKNKSRHLIHSTRVMTLAVAQNDIPWSSPVYFVFQYPGFYFFSNERSRHVQQSLNGQAVGVSIFHDSDQIDNIFGF